MSPLVVWLGSSEARDVTGRVFNVRGGSISVAEPWHAGPDADKDERWDPAELGPVVHDLLSSRSSEGGCHSARPGQPRRATLMDIRIDSEKPVPSTSTCTPGDLAAKLPRDTSGPTRDDTLARMTQRSGVGGQTPDETAEYLSAAQRRVRHVGR